MPVTKQAAKKMRRDRKIASANAKIRRSLRETIKKTRANPTKKNLDEAYSSLDKSAKKRIIHPNRSARLKSRLSKLESSKKSK